MKTFQILFAMLFACALSQSVLAQSDKSDRLKDTTSSLKLVTYTCPMHPEEMSDKPGKCAKCGMPLALSKKELMKADAVKYTCPMHPDVASDKPGKCPKCGMALTAVKPKKN